MKRIRVELDVHESALPAWNRAAHGNTEKGPDVWHTQVRSVEVVEPERWTELVLRADQPYAWRPGNTVNVVSAHGPWLPERPHGAIPGLWRVTSCTEREEYPAARASSAPGSHPDPRAPHRT